VTRSLSGVFDFRAPFTGFSDVAKFTKLPKAVLLLKNIKTSLIISFGLEEANHKFEKTS
jgi:hypothetical protein